MEIWHDKRGEPVVWTHAQNMRKDYKSGWHWRGWLHAGERHCFGAEFHIPGRRFGFTLGFEDDVERAITFAIHLLMFSAYFSIDRAMWVRILPGVRRNKEKWSDGQREVGFVFGNYGNGIDMHWHLWTNPDEWKKGDRKGIVHFDELLYGKPNTTKAVIGEGSTDLVLPEATYLATWNLTEFTRRWRRFRKPKVWRKYEIEIEGGIAVPGKGENSWDIGDTALYSMSVGPDATTLDEAKERVVASVLKDRAR